MVILVKEYTLVSLGSAISLRSTDSGFIAEDSKCLAHNSVCWPNFVFRHSPWFPLAVGAGVFGETSFESRGKHPTERKRMINNKDLEPIVLIPHIIETGTTSVTSGNESKTTSLVSNSSEIIITCPIIVDGNEIVPEIPRKEAEQDRLKDQNSELLKQIQELKFKLSNYDKTPVCTKCTDHAKSDCVVKLQQKFKAFEEKISALEIQNAELKTSLQEEKEKSNVKTSSTQQSSEISKKTLQEKKDLELRCIKLSKQVSDFEKILITKRDTFAKERKVLEDKNTEFSKQISVLQDLLEKERQFFKEKKKSFESEKKNSEKRNVGIFNEISDKSKNLQKDFEQERSYFETEISKLMSKISVLSSDILKEQLARSDLKKKFDTITSERNILVAKMKDLEAANVNLSEKISADVINQSPVDNSTESVCSFKTASSSIHDKNAFKKKNVKLITIKSSQIRPSNLFYDKSVDGSVSYYVKSLGKQSKKTQMVWRVKDSSEEKKKDKAFKSTTKAKKNSTHKGKSFGNSDIFYSTNHLIRIAQRKICCSYCGENDFVQRESAHNWTRTSKYKMMTSKYYNLELGLQCQRHWLLNNSV
ncbi:hypothetical protein L6452_15013 [Arctium lappa]|uniref:Uncharacterized protein n=1 Tax=Arctium lappa TaxID=4217 RepID=A0ACB9CMV7_ARCLA|nr:hypothetical protein L6452_15013 [Arctium lappa]